MERSYPSDTHPIDPDIFRHFVSVSGKTEATRVVLCWPLCQSPVRHVANVMDKWLVRPSIRLPSATLFAVPLAFQLFPSSSFFFFFFQFRARNGANEFDNEIDDGLKRAGRKVSHIDCQLDGVLEWRAPDRFNLSLSLPSFSPFVQRSWWLYSLSPPQYCARGLSARKKEKKGNKKTDQAIQRVELKSGTTTSSTYSLPPHYSHHLLRPKCCSVSVCGGGDVTECVRAPSMRDAIHSITVDPNATSIYEMRLCLLSTTPCDIIPKSLRVLSLHSQLAPSCDYLFVHLTKGRKRKKKY